MAQVVGEMKGSRAADDGNVSVISQPLISGEDNAGIAKILRAKIQPCDTQTLEDILADVLLKHLAPQAVVTKTKIVQRACGKHVGIPQGQVLAAIAHTNSKLGQVRAL